MSRWRNGTTIVRSTMAMWLHWMWMQSQRQVSTYGAVERMNDLLISQFSGVVNSTTIYTEMLYRNRENINENAEQAIRMDMGVGVSSGVGVGGGLGAITFGGTAIPNRVDPEKKSNAAICTMSTSMMPSAGLFVMMSWKYTRAKHIHWPGQNNLWYFELYLQ